MVENETEKAGKDVSVLGTIRRTISSATGLRHGSLTSEQDHKTYVSFDSPEPDLAPPDLPSDDEDHTEDDGIDRSRTEETFGEEEEAEDDYSSGIREIAEMQNRIENQRFAYLLIVTYQLVHIRVDHAPVGNRHICICS